MPDASSPKKRKRGEQQQGSPAPSTEAGPSQPQEPQPAAAQPGLFSQLLQAAAGPPAQGVLPALVADFSALMDALPPAEHASKVGGGCWGRTMR